MTTNLKKLIAIALTIALCIGLGAPALAGGEPSAYGPSYIINDLYYPLDLDDKGEGWYYTAATRTLTIENLESDMLGLYAFYEEENLYIEMVGDSKTQYVQSICFPTSDTENGGDIFFIGDGSLNVNGSISGRNFGFHSGKVTAGTVSTVSWMETAVTIYDGAALKLYGGALQSNSFVINGGSIEIICGYAESMTDMHTYTINAGEISLSCTEGYDALRVSPDVYASLAAAGVEITSGDGAETMHYTFGDNNYIRLASDSESYLDNVVITGSGTPTAAPERPTGMTDNTPTTDEKPDGSQSTETSGNESGSIGGSLEEFVAMATEMGLDLSTVSTEMVHMYAEELGYDLSGYSDEELAAILMELAMVQDAISGETETTEKPAIVSELAVANTQSVLVDGEQVTFEVYALEDENGGETNYIKLRDLAFILNGSAAQFEVSWDGAVNILSGQAYTPNGSEMDTPFEGDREYAPTDAVTKVDGVVTEFDAICLTDDNGGEYNYYKLRDLGKVLGFDVSWSAEQGIYIETDQPYTDD